MSTFAEYGSQQSAQWALERMGLAGVDRERARQLKAATKTDRPAPELPVHPPASAARVKEVFDRREELSTLADARTLFPNNPILTGHFYHPEASGEPIVNILTDIKK